MTTPSSGGRYIREKDGTLRRVGDEAQSASTESSKPDPAPRSTRQPRNNAAKE